MRDIHHFFRAGYACAISRSDGELYWGHVGFTEKSPLHGRHFLAVASTRLYRVTMPLTGNRILDQRWWLGFEARSPWSYDDTLEELKLVADGLDAASAVEH